VKVRPMCGPDKTFKVTFIASVSLVAIKGYFEISFASKVRVKD
jgi:hypothetical protein